MPILRLICLAGFMLFTLVNSAFAENTPISRKDPGNPPSSDFNQTIYKGVVGNVLDAVPMDPAQRVTLQRTNAVISNTLSGRSLSALAKLTNPALLIGSIVWGLWAASNINPPASAVSVPPEPASEAEGDTKKGMDTDIADHASLTVTPRLTSTDFKPASMTMRAPAESVVHTAPRPQVIKIWLSQPSK